jgi:hypothetical protein
MTTFVDAKKQFLIFSHSLQYNNFDNNYDVVQPTNKEIKICVKSCIRNTFIRSIAFQWMTH